MKRFVFSCGVTMALALSGCVQHRPLYVQYTDSHPPPEPAVDAKGNPLSEPELLPDGRWVKQVDIRSEPWGARIMVGGFYVGETPMLVPIPCTPAGRFTQTTKIRLIPNEAGGRVHGDLFPAGAMVPTRLYFSGTSSAEN